MEPWKPCKHAWNPPSQSPFMPFLCFVSQSMSVGLMELMLLLLKYWVMVRKIEIQFWETQGGKILLVLNSMVASLQWPHWTHCEVLQTLPIEGSGQSESCPHTAEKVLTCWLQGIWTQNLGHVHMVIVDHLETDMLISFAQQSLCFFPGMLGFYRYLLNGVWTNLCSKLVSYF